MGLDMSFYLKRADNSFIWRNDDREKVLGRYPGDIRDVAEKFDRDPCVISVTKYELLYFRGAYAIHNWIVDNCANGLDEYQEIPMDAQELSDLRSDARKILEAWETMEEDGFAEVASEIMPTGSGRYDENYVDTIRTLERALDAIIRLMDEPGHETDEIVYQAS